MRLLNLIVVVLLDPSTETAATLLFLISEFLTTTLLESLILTPQTASEMVTLSIVAPFAFSSLIASALPISENVQFLIITLEAPLMRIP